MSGMGNVIGSVKGSDLYLTFYYHGLTQLLLW